MKSAYLEAGRFRAPHGVKGDIKADCWCDSVEVLQKLHTVYIDAPAGKRELKVARCVPFKDLALMHIEGYGDPEQASFLKNKVFYARREDLPLPEGSYFIADLIGLPVYDADTGRVYGNIKEVEEGAASQLYVVQTPDGGTKYLPVVPAFVIEIDPEKGIAARPVKGLFDED